MHRWRGYKLFVKARHVQPAPAGASLDTATRRWQADDTVLNTVVALDRSCVIQVVHGGDSGKPGARAKAAAGLLGIACQSTEYMLRTACILGAEAEPPAKRLKKGGARAARGSRRGESHDLSASRRLQQVGLRASRSHSIRGLQPARLHKRSLGVQPSLAKVWSRLLPEEHAAQGQV